MGDQTIYEYSEAALKCWGGIARYNDYQIVRFLEDFFGIFRYVGESIPEELYLGLDEFTDKMDAWKCAGFVLLEWNPYKNRLGENIRTLR